MVSIRPDQVYNVLRYDWEPGKYVRKRLEQSLGLTDLSFLDKLGYALMFQYWGVTDAKFFGQIAKLKDQRLVDLRYYHARVGGHIIEIPEVRKLPSINNPEQPEVQGDGVADLV